ncbi:hypothetical protein NDU88_002698 [Pleurodeles waltl]|uniref:Uncharacterized protein n=1 Tax=Pleurodeles waltl TaxID=8319 RepID=A0AAV7WLY2_PLEWA|nr:hypothetical protein NDU88_002698 [Pleurodeles waltl]
MGARELPNIKGTWAKRIASDLRFKGICAQSVRNSTPGLASINFQLLLPTYEAHLGMPLRLDTSLCSFGSKSGDVHRNYVKHSQLLPGHVRSTVPKPKYFYRKSKTLGYIY